MDGGTAGQASEHRSLAYMPQLDGLRAVAVLAVWLDHWELGRRSVLRHAKWGDLGVTLFFALSGFLITSILLKGRANIEAGELVGAESRRFWARRFLRILPAYFLVLCGTALFLPAVREFFWYHATYTTNFYCLVAPNRTVPAFAGGHFWSLAVEEQFYLIWPWAIFLLPRRSLLPLVVVMIVGAPLFRAGCIGAGYKQAATQLPFGAMDALGVGALLSILRDRRRAAGDPTAAPARGPALPYWRRPWRAWNGPALTARQERLLLRGCLLAGLPLLLLLMWDHRQVTTTQVVLTRTAMSLVWVWLLAAASTGFGGVVGWALTCRPMLYLGKISYGLYLYHMFVPDVLPRLGFRLPEGHEHVWVLARFAILSGATVLVAAASWHLVEKPVNGLKRFFEPPPAPKGRPPRGPPNHLDPNEGQTGAGLPAGATG